MKNYIAQSFFEEGEGFRGFGTFGLAGKNAENSSMVFTSFLSTTIGVMTIIGIIWFVIQFFLGAISIIFSAGDKGKLTEAKGKITTALIGLIVVISAIFIIDLVGSVIGIQILNLADMIDGLRK